VPPAVALLNCGFIAEFSQYITKLSPEELAKLRLAGWGSLYFVALVIQLKDTPPITWIFRGISLNIIIIAGRNSEAAIGGEGGAQRLVLRVK
jgi:hypothetical protein